MPHHAATVGAADELEPQALTQAIVSVCAALFDAGRTLSRRQRRRRGLAGGGTTVAPLQCFIPVIAPTDSVDGKEKPIGWYVFQILPPPHKTHRMGVVFVGFMAYLTTQKRVVCRHMGGS